MLTDAEYMAVLFLALMGARESAAELAVQCESAHEKEDAQDDNQPSDEVP